MIAPFYLACIVCIVGVREGVIVPFLTFVPDNGFKTVCQMTWVNSITLPQSESIILTLILIPTTSERYSVSLC